MSSAALVATDAIGVPSGPVQGASFHRLLLAIALTAVTLAALVPSGRVAQAPTGTTVAAASFDRQIDLNGRSLHLRCQGSGGPVVILEAGYGMTLEGWRAVQDGVAATTRVCAYDRAGLGASAPSAIVPRDGETVVEELRALLQSAGVSPPYILSGFSIGGLLVRLYSVTYPDEVLGLILVDPTPPAWPQANVDMAAPQARDALQRRLAGQDPREPERLDVLALAAAVGETEPASGLPATVITAGITTPAIAGASADTLDRLIQRMHQQEIEWLRAEHLVAPFSPHAIPEHDPRIVIDATADMVRLLQLIPAYE